MSAPAGDGSISAVRGTLIFCRDDPFLIGTDEAFVCEPDGNRRSRSITETLAVLTTLGDDRAIRATYVAGKVASVDPRPGPAHGPPP